MVVNVYSIMNSRVRKNAQTIDAKAFDLLRSRDPVFLQSVFNEVNPYLVRVCVANGLFQEDVRDLVHQTWEKFFANLDQFEGRSQLRTFICGILINKIREHRRLHQRIAPEEDVHKVMDDAFTPDGWWKVTPSDPYRMAEAREVQVFVKQCIEGLSEQQMAAFVMKEVEEQDADEVCQILGVNSSHLRVLLFRAKEKLRKCLEGKMEKV